MERRVRRVAGIVVAALALPGPCAAHALTLAWDPNQERDLAGYIVTTTDPAGGDRRTDVGPVTTWTAAGLDAGVTYCFSVQAYNASGLASPPSNAVCATTDGSPASIDESIDQWSSRHGLSPASIDADADGVTDAEEFARGTHPLIPATAYLTEGATGAFAERLAHPHPDVVPADVTLQFLLDSGLVRTERVRVPARARRTVDVNSLLGPVPVAASVVMTTSRGGAVLERTMGWSAQPSHVAAHTAKAATGARRDWYLAEGSAHWFDTWILVANPNARPVSVRIDFAIEDAPAVSRTYTVAPTSRFSLLASDVPGLAGRSFAARVRADGDVTVERAMYFGTAGTLWRGGHVAPAVASPGRRWFVAEGRTGPFFDTWLLLGNPGGRAATVTLRYLTPDGEALREVRTMQPEQRVTIHVDSLPGLADTDVSVVVESTAPIVVERSMYWPGTADTWQEGHSSPGLTRLGTLWALAEGEWGGARRAETFVLLANPGRTPAEVSLRALREEGRAPREVRRLVAPGRRLTVSLAEFGLADGERCGFLVESSAPIAVERSMYWSTPDRYWSAGTNETGTVLR